MKEGKASRTAEIVAVWRAVESRRPEDERVCYDPIAMDFLGTPFSMIGKCGLLSRIGLWYAEQVAPGAAGWVAGRTRYIDDYLNACIDDRIEQLVILGAGYDSRAYRFEELKGNVVIFEVDYPSTQKVKIEKVKKIFGYLPDNVVYVPIDFDKETLYEKLFDNGYNQDLKTLFIWEGVTMYITAEAVDGTLDFVANHSGKGSSIIFSYVFQSVVEGTCELEGAKKWLKALQRRGEPPIFGIEENTVEEFLLSRGFCQVKDVTMAFLKEVYFKGRNQDRKVPGWGGVVSATVEPSKQA